MTVISNATKKEDFKVSFIIAISGRIRHYTCVTGISGNSLKLKDSAGLVFIHQDKFRVTTSVEDSEDYLVCPTYYKISTKQ